MQTRKVFQLVGLAMLAGASNTARAQGGGGWSFECIDPANTAPYSTDFATIGVQNAFIGIRMGVSGTVTYGGATGPCYAPTARTLNASGRFALFVGGQGSAQSDFDDNLALTVGAPRDAAGDYAYAVIYKITDPTAPAAGQQFLFGANGINGYFVGASKRYFKATVNIDATLAVELETRVVGDAARLNWKFRHLSGDSYNVGMRFGAYVGMRSSRPDITGANQANSLLGTLTGNAKPTGLAQDGLAWIGYTSVPTTKPLRTEHNFLASRNSFPEYINFLFGQEAAYGLRVDTISTPQTPDATKAAQIIVGNHGAFQSPGLLINNVMRTRVFDDFGTGDPVFDANPSTTLEDSDINLSETSYITTYAATPLSGGNTRDIVQYFRSPWSVGDYRDPYAALLDAPKIIATGSGDNGLNPNPMRIIAYVDNQYATINKEVPLTNIRLTITLPEGGGLTLAPGEARQKTITRIDPNDIANVEWSVIADGKQFGKLPYSVKIEPNPGPARTLESSILVAATPKLRLGEGPNLVTLPFQFADTALDSVLGLKQGIDYIAYKWEPDLGEYVPITSAARGTAVWIVPTSDKGFVTLSGASVPADNSSGGYTTTLRPGWNMIGNPYNFPVVLSQLVAVAEDDPKNALTWQELIDSQLVLPSLAYWNRNPEDPNSGNYVFTQGAADVLQPSTGYWVYVTAFNPIKVIWPAIYAEGLPGSLRSAKSTTTTWQQSDKRWRLQLAARTVEGIDANNFVGVASNKKDANATRMPKPPRSPKNNIELSIEDSINGQPTRMAQTLAESGARKEWKVYVRAEKAGEVTVTWPNISTVPRNVRLQMVDKATNTRRDLRFSSSYTFTAAEAGTREFTIQMEPGAPARAVIGDVIVTRPTRDPRAPFTISYALSSQASTTIRILGGAGKEIFTVTRGRADREGQNSATWTMRDNANRAVAPGAYQVEIVAETVTGERVRKIVPVNVVR